MATKPKIGIPVNSVGLVLTDESPDDYVGTRYIQPAVAPEPIPESSGLIRRIAGDGIITAVKGAIGVPEAAVGLADMLSGGHAGKALENEGGAIGFRPKEAKEWLDQFYSPEQRAAFQAVRTAANPEDSLGRRVLDTGAAALSNPSTIAHAVGESLPSMFAGGVIGRAVMAAAPKVAGFAAGGIGEGVVSAGSTAEQIRQGTKDGLMTGGQSLVAAGSGALTMGLGIVAAKAAKSMGVGDIDTLIVGGKSVDPALQKGFVRRVVEGAFSEGVLEELPQSVQEQVAQNFALGKPLDEGVDQAAVMGMLSGGAMGFGAQVIRRQPEVGPLSRAANAAPPPDTAANAPASPAPAADPLSPERTQSLLDHANARMRVLDEKANGVPESKEVGADGKEVITPERLKEFLTPAETAEIEFLKAAGGDADALARVYPGVTAPLAPVDDQQIIGKIERDAKREYGGAAGRARAGIEADDGDGVVSGAPTAPTGPGTPTGGTLANDDEGDLPMADQDDITAPSGNPFKERFAAKRAATRQPDPEAFTIVRVQGGYVLRRIAGVPNDKTADAPAVVAEPGTGSGDQSGGGARDSGNKQGSPGTLAGDAPATPAGRGDTTEPVGDAGAGTEAVAPPSEEPTQISETSGTIKGQENGSEVRDRGARPQQDADIQDLAKREGPNEQPEEPVLPQLRREGGNDVQGVDGELPELSGSDRPETEPTSHAGPQGQQPTVPAGQLAVGDQEGAGQKSAEERADDAPGQDSAAGGMGRGNGAGPIDPALPDSPGRDDARTGADDAANGRSPVEEDDSGGNRQKPRAPTGGGTVAEPTPPTDGGRITTAEPPTSGPGTPTGDKKPDAPAAEPPTPTGPGTPTGDATEPEPPKAPKKERPEDVIELRKRISVLNSLLECMG